MDANRMDGGEPSIHYGDYSLEHGYETARRLFERKPATTAIYCGDDLVAFGVIAGLKSRGVRVPREVSVVSFGNDPIARYFDPPLTTVDYPDVGHGQAGVQPLQEPHRPRRALGLEPRSPYRVDRTGKRGPRPEVTIFGECLDRTEPPRLNGKTIN